MIVFFAESGTQINISKSINSVQELAHEIKDFVPVDAQILLTVDGAQWKGVNQDVFVFNRLILDPSTANTAAHSIDIEPPVPSSTVINMPAALPDGRGLPPSERLDMHAIAFKSHGVYGKSILDIAQKHLTTCERLLREQQIQTKALDIAIQNLESHAKSTYEIFNAYNSVAQKEFTKHASLLQSCPSDLNTLAQIQIHNSIVSENRNLDDYVPKEKLFAWAKRCQESHDHLFQKANQLVENMQEIRLGCNAEELHSTGVEFPKLFKLLETSKDVVHKMEMIQSNFLRDLTKVQRSRADEFETRIQAIDSLYKIHTQEYIPEITKYDRYVRETVIYFSDSKLHLTQILQVKLQAISHYQSLIATISPTISSLTNVLNMQSEALLQLLHVHRMAPAWGATLVEIVRRKEYVRIFLQKAKDMADILNQFRNQEQRRRDTFKSEILRYIPVGLIQGLDESPPYCEISVSNTKDSLPNLKIDDIQAFEKMIFSLKHSQMSGDPSIASDSISKLQATMLKMLPQLENITAEFEKIVIKTGFLSLDKRFEEENRNLKQQLSVKSRPVTSEPPVQSTDPELHSKSALYPKQEEMIKAYELRIKSLEKVLQERYHAPQDSNNNEKIQQLYLELEEEKKRNENQAKQLSDLEHENENLRKKIAEQAEKNEKVEKNCEEFQLNSIKEQKANEELKTTICNFEKDSAKQKQLLLEVSTHLHSCLLSLKSSEDSMVHFDSIVIPNSIHADNLRQMMRKVEDDIISQMALLSNLKSLNDSVGIASDDAQTVAHELVELLQRISDLEIIIRESESELTQVQAREAVVEAECNSVKKILSKTTESLEQHQSYLHAANENLKKEKSEKKSLDEQNVRLQRDLDEQALSIKVLMERNLQQSRIITPELGVQNILHSQLRVCREALEDWAIISKLSIDLLSKCYADLLQIQVLVGMNQNPEISCHNILALEIESIPDDLDQFLPIISVLIKQTYEKVVAMGAISSNGIINEVKGQFKVMKHELGNRISFQRFQVSSLCLFLPTKNPVAWAAFHVDSPHFFLAPESHPSFDARIKKREWILGKISEISTHTAGHDGDNNRFGLSKGTMYHVCSALPFQYII